MATLGIPYPKTTAHSPLSPARAARYAASLGALVALALAGDAVAGTLRLPVPGPLLGASALVTWLALRPADAAGLPAADGLIRALPLLFVPLVVGAAAPLRALGPALVPVALTVLAATLAALAATVAAASLVQWLCSRSR